MSISLEQLAIYRPSTAFLDDFDGGSPTLNVLAFLPDGLEQLAYDPIAHGRTGWRTRAVATDPPYDEVVASNDLDFYLFTPGYVRYIQDIIYTPRRGEKDLCYRY
jgi:hypothetical protein